MKFRPVELDSVVLTVQKPSRYVGGEVHSVHKDLAEMRVTWALLFPDTYEVGMSNVGFRLLYDVLNRRRDTACERGFMPWPDMAALLRARGLPLFSIESRAPLRDFDVLGFSLQFEAAYTTCLEMLDLARVPIFAADRGPDDPLVLAGGPCTVNGEPVAPFFDAMVIGDGEEVVNEITDVVADWKGSGASRAELLWRLAEVPGVYVPSLFEPRYQKDGTLAAIEPKKAGYERVRRRLIADLNLAPHPERPMVPFMQTVHDRLPLELQRGCTRGCRFCQAGMISRPTRQRDPRRVLELAVQGLACSGFEEVGFLSLSAGDYPALDPLLRSFLDRFGPQRVALSLPSLRTETMSEQLARRIGQVKKTGFTLAPEAATDRLRRVINKGNSEDALIAAAESVFRSGWALLKLYFMIGLPTETDEDVLAIPELAKRTLRHARAIRSSAQINVSVSTFVPKPFTPFQWEALVPVAETVRRHDLLRKAFPRKGPLAYKYHDAEGSVMEAALARGDRRLATAVHEAWRRGQVLDGWTEHFNFGRWQQAFEALEKTHGIGVDFLVHRERAESEVLPWDHIDVGVTKSFLLRERARARAGQTLPDCAGGPCGGCGVCDFKVIEPRLADASSLGALVDEPRPEPQPHPLPQAEAQGAPVEAPPPAEGAADSAPQGTAADVPEDSTEASSTAERRETVNGGQAPPRHVYRIRHGKLGRARAISHLETMTVISRALRRSALPIAYTAGFSPHPRVSLGPALAVGTESQAEYFDIETAEPIDASRLFEALAAVMPEGFPILEAFELPRGSPSLNAAMVGIQYVARFPDSVSHETLEAGVRAFAGSEPLGVERTRHGSRRTRHIDLKQAIREIDFCGTGRIRFTLAVAPTGSARPAEVLAALFGGAEGVALFKERVLFETASPRE